MVYLNQLEYEHIPYPTRVKQEVPKNSTVRSSGCGPCCVCMIVDALTTETLSIEECIRISEECVANYSAGTDMNVLGPVIAERYGLEYTKTSELSALIAHLKKGGKAIAHVGVPEGKEIGLFTKGGHYVALMDTDGETVTILDPSYTPQKFHIPEREGRVNDADAPFIYCDAQILHSETKPNRVKYHLFARKKK